MTNPLATLCDGPAALLAVYDRIGEGRATLGYDIDGVVYKVDDLALQKRLGFRSTTPRWAVAHKFSAERAWTRLLGIQINVGRTGALAPLAKLQPVTVGGVVVSNATLHNEDYIAGRSNVTGEPIRGGRDLRVGDWVESAARATSSPRSWTWTSRARARLGPLRLPDDCPRCGSDAPREAGDAVRRCTGGWPARPRRSRSSSTSSAATPSTSRAWGIKQVEMFFGDPAPARARARRHLHHGGARRGRTPEKLRDRLGYGERAAQPLRRHPRRAARALARLIFALGIRHLGEVAATLRGTREREAWWRRSTRPPAALAHAPPTPPGEGARAAPPRAQGPVRRPGRRRGRARRVLEPGRRRPARRTHGPWSRVARMPGQRARGHRPPRGAPRRPAARAARGREPRRGPLGGLHRARSRA
jgi:DNA ligase (NAD+)